MKRIVFLLLLTLAACSPKVSSPDGRITIIPGEGCCLVQYEGQKVLELQIPVTADDLKRAWTKKVLVKDNYRGLDQKSACEGQLQDDFRQTEGLPV